MSYHLYSHFAQIHDNLLFWNADIKMKPSSHCHNIPIRYRNNIYANQPLSLADANAFVPDAGTNAAAKAAVTALPADFMIDTSSRTLPSYLS